MSREWRGDRVYTAAGMRRGDAIVWRSNRVPHASGWLVRDDEDADARHDGGDDGEGDDGDGRGSGAVAGGLAPLLRPPQRRREPRREGDGELPSWDRPERSSFDFRCICMPEGAPPLTEETSL